GGRPRGRARDPSRPQGGDASGHRASARRAGGRRPDGRGPADRGRDRARVREQGRRLSAVPETAPAAAPVRESRLRALGAFYLATMRAAIQTQLQYRVANYFYMLGMVAEPVIYLVVWSSVADSQGGSVQGITAGQFAAYYIVWTLVRNMNIVFGAPFWEWRIREGQLSGQLLRPLHPLHYDVAYFAGWKFVVIGLWIPIAIVLSAIFHPDLHPSGVEVVVFCIAIWGAYLVRTMFQSTIGMLNFWTTRGG